VLNRPATFTLHRDEGEDVVHHGVLSELEQLHELDGIGFYRARLVPRLWWLTMTHHNQVFLDQPVPGFLKAALLDGGLTGLDFEFRLMGDYQPEDYVCQYQESHFDFMSRWLEREGLYFFFEQGPDREKVVFTDAAAAHRDLPQRRQLAYAPPSGLGALQMDETIRTFSCRSRVLPAQVLLRDYDYQRPTLDLSSRAEVDQGGQGQVYLYGERFRTPDHGRRLAAVRKEELQCRRSEYRGEGSVPFLTPGYLFQLARHFRDDFNRKYLVVETRHRGSQTGYLLAGLNRVLTGMESEVFYQNEFTAIPGDVQYRPERRTGRPRIAGTLSATVDAAGTGQYAELDEHGRYKVIMPFDLSGRRDAKASAYLRMAQPYAGEDHGMHFPLHRGTEVLLTFLDGDPDRPIIAAAVPDALHPSVVRSGNQTQSGIKTSGGNRIFTEDKEGEQHVALHSPFHNSNLILGSHRPGGGGSILGWTSGDEAWVSKGKKIQVIGGNAYKLVIGRQSTVRTCRSYSYNAANTYTFGFDLFNLDRYAEYFSQEAAAASGWKSTLKAVGTGLGAGVKAVQAAVKAATGEESTSLIAGVSNLTVNWIDQDTINFGVGKTLNLKPALSTCAINKVTLAGGMDRTSRWRYGLATIAGFIPLATEFARTICRVNEAVAAADSADPSRISDDLDRYQRCKAVLDAACEIVVAFVKQFGEKELSYATNLTLDHKALALKARPTGVGVPTPKITAETADLTGTQHSVLTLDNDKSVLKTEQTTPGLTEAQRRPLSAAALTLTRTKALLRSSATPNAAALALDTSPAPSLVASVSGTGRALLRLDARTGALSFVGQAAKAQGAPRGQMVVSSSKAMLNCGTDAAASSLEITPAKISLADASKASAVTLAADQLKLASLAIKMTSTSAVTINGQLIKLA
jgi:type VI secretion system VgrG family protein